MTALREKIADRLAYFDECGPGPVSRGEYLEDADEIIKMVVADVDRWLRTKFPSGTTMMAEDRRHGPVEQTKGEYVASYFRRAYATTD